MTALPKKNDAGFTLIELSIVLVIIGLIAGGILVGQDMIKAAEIRSTVKQVEQYNAAVNTFRDKYRFIPGDIAASTATQFGLLPAARAGTAGHGDGNGILEGGATGATALSAETGLIWRDMNAVGLLDGSFVSAIDGPPAAALTSDTVKTWLPEAKMGRGNLIAVYGTQGSNFYQIGGVSAVSTAGVYTLAATMTPQEAFNIDAKTDDGKPNTGSARAMVATGAALNTPAVAATCVDATTTAGIYTTTTDTLANTPTCALRVRFN